MIIIIKDEGEWRVKSHLIWRLRDWKRPRPTENLKLYLTLHSILSQFYCKGNICYKPGTRGGDWWWCVRSKTKYFLLISNEKTIKSTACNREINNFNWNWKCSYNTPLHSTPLVAKYSCISTSHLLCHIAIDCKTMLKNFIPFDHERKNERQSIPSRLSSPPFSISFRCRFFV